MPRPPRVLALVILLIASALPAADDVKVSPGVVEDQRFTDERFGGLSVGLVLKGGAVADVKAIRVRVKSAKDDVGTVLYKPEKDEKPKDFEDFSTSTGLGPAGPQAHLLSPRRDAATVDVAGEIELFVPARDPNTKQRFERFLSGLDRPIGGSSLKAAKVEITPLSPKEYEARQKKNRPTKDQIRAEGKKQGVSDAEIEQAIAMMDALASLGGEAPSENSILLETKDPDGRIIAVDLVGADGKELQARSRGSNGGRELKLVKIDLSEKPPADAALVVTLRTPKSVVTVPFNLKEVPLP